MLKNIEALKYKISILDKTAFSIEQDCKRKEQQLQELIDKKDRIEKLIANILNGEGYSKLNQIVKDNIKSILAENKQIISVAFTALLQTLQNDPEIIKAIYNISTNTNDGEKYKDNDNNNVSKYLEVNKDRIIELSEKNHQNLVEALINDAINNATAACSNPTLSLRQSSSTFPNLSDQSNTYRIEEPEIYDDSKGDIAD